MLASIRSNVQPFRLLVSTISCKSFVGLTKLTGIEVINQINTQEVSTLT